MPKREKSACFSEAVGTEVTHLFSEGNTDHGNALEALRIMENSGVYPAAFKWRVSRDTAVSVCFEFLISSLLALSGGFVRAWRSWFNPLKRFQRSAIVWKYLFIGGFAGFSIFELFGKNRSTILLFWERTTSNCFTTLLAQVSQGDCQDRILDSTNACRSSWICVLSGGSGRVWRSWFNPLRGDTCVVEKPKCLPCPATLLLNRFCLTLVG